MGNTCLGSSVGKHAFFEGVTQPNSYVPWGRSSFTNPSSTGPSNRSAGTTEPRVASKDPPGLSEDRGLGGEPADPFGTLHHPPVANHIPPHGGTAASGARNPSSHADQTRAPPAGGDHHQQQQQRSSNHQQPQQKPQNQHSGYPQKVVVADPVHPAGAMSRQGPNAPVGQSLTQSVLQRVTEPLRDHFTLGRKLGQGQFGTTYFCIEKATGKEYACKSIAKRKLISQEDVEDVRREIHIMHHLSGHPNIVTIKGAYEDSSSVHLVMELCAGGELFDRIIQRGHYSEAKAALLTRIIVGVVEACHSLGVMHRDLKPENFLLANRSEDAALKATDFGLSVFFRPGGQLSVHTDHSSGCLQWRCQEC